MSGKGKEDRFSAAEKRERTTMEVNRKGKKTSRLYLMIRYLVKVFSPKYTLEGTENIPDGPCVIVGNHSQMYGPIAGELYTPGKHAIWCASEMMDRKEVASYAFSDFWSDKPKSVRWFYRLLSHVWVFCTFVNK